MSKYKLIALDLDGTLLNSRKEISSQNLHWIRKAEQSGLIVSFATGRSRSSSEPYWDTVSSEAPMIISNGAEVWENHNRLLSRYALPCGEVPKLLALAREYAVHYWTNGSCGEDGSVVGECLKIGMYDPDLSIISEIRELVTSWNKFEVSSSAANNVEINRKGVTKAAGLAEVVGPLGIKPSEVVAIGDGINDLAMLKWAGLGVAMENAPEIVKEAADLVTAANDDDGVAQMIQSILE
ncbi:MAG: HAD family phosphatase [Firmicutes bacterium]|nr:HAD family phosphatase [Bacillota bacterium]